MTPSPPVRLTMLEYDPGGRPTTENGVPVPEPYSLLEGRPSLAADRSWENAFFGPHGPDVIGLSHDDAHHHVLAVVGDPVTPTDHCDVGEQPASADALVRSISARPGLCAMPRARLYVIDVAGEPARTVAVLIMAPSSGFNRVLEAAQPVLKSIEVATD